MLSEQQLKIRYLNVGEVFKKREYCHIIWSLARANHLLVKKLPTERRSAALQ